MRLRAHLISAALLGVTMYPRRPLRALLVLIGGVAIDADHYLLYALRSGSRQPLDALRYDRVRKHPIVRGDTRPRYGSLRSVFHLAHVSLPPLALLALRIPLVRPILAGLTLHLILDFHWPHFDRRAWRRAAGRCERCGVAGLDREVFFIRDPKRGGQPRAIENRLVLCNTCAREFHAGRHAMY